MQSSMWLDSPTWPASQAFYHEHIGILTAPSVGADLDTLIEADPNDARLSIHRALVDLARFSHVDVGYAYLTAAGRGKLDICF